MPFSLIVQPVELPDVFSKLLTGFGLTNRRIFQMNKSSKVKIPVLMVGWGFVLYFPVGQVFFWNNCQIVKMRHLIFP
jgi:hypothetical protein